ncbi:MAG TPA: class I SAM-dependent methyltransferase [Terriglobia bacterium]|nr:class I SAM-dependent methyltransferase [Terriglobia bacterium]
METVACNLCGSTRYTPVYEMPDTHYPADEFFTVVECNECGLGFLNPRPTLAEMQKYYPPRYYEEGFDRNPGYHQKRYALEAGYLGPPAQSTENRKLLDVGCANGDFPTFMNTRGWCVEGVEISTSSRPIQNFKVYNQLFPDIPVNKPTYDAVTAWAVLEHVHDPMTYFRKASRVLKQGGVFVFLVTNFNSLASRHLFCEDVPRHLYFFTSKTVRRYLEASGFRLQSEHFRGNIYKMPPNNWLHYLLHTGWGKRSFTYRNLPMSRPDFIQRNGLRPGLSSTIRFAISHPLTVLDRALMPLVVGVQILRKSYGIFTVVARKI